MSDASVDLIASNLFGLSANFTTSASSTSTPQSNVPVNDEVGNVSCQRNISDIISYTQSASYCGSDFVGDLATFLTEFGNFQTVGVLTGLSISLSASGYVTVDLTGHQHDENAHEAGLAIGHADMSDFFPHEVGESFENWDGFGVPDFGVTVGADASPASASVSFSMNHVDQMGETGSHLVGKNLTPRAELSMDFVGIPTSNTAALLEADFDGNTNKMLVPLVDSEDSSDSNSDFDTFAFTAHANTDLATV